MKIKKPKHAKEKHPSARSITLSTKNKRQASTKASSQQVPRRRAKSDKQS